MYMNFNNNTNNKRKRKSLQKGGLNLEYKTIFKRQNA
ncbi:MAG: hypothetical protein ACI9TY_000281 [Alphaproteobacteria bacterium]|jgi:hypothetical protein